MSYKPLAEVELLQESTENTNVLIEEDGKVRRVPKNEIGEKCAGGTVKTVNNIEPDEKGNVEIEVGGGVTSWNDLPDRPFGEEVKRYATFATRRIERDYTSLFEDEFDDHSIRMDDFVILFNSVQYKAKKYTMDTGMGYDDHYFFFEECDNHFVAPFYIKKNTMTGVLEIFVNDSSILPFDVELCSILTDVKKIDSKYLPTAEAVGDVTDNPTAEDFNTLLDALRNAGYLSW